MEQNNYFLFQVKVFNLPTVSIHTPKWITEFERKQIFIDAIFFGILYFYF